MMENLIPTGIALSMAGTFLAGLLGLVGRKAHRPSAILLALATLIGAVSAFAFLVGDQTASFATFASPFNSFKLDTLSAVFLLLVNGVACPVALYGLTYFEHEADHLHLPVTNFLTALFVGGMQGVLLSSHALGFILFWEVMSMASFFLVMAHKKQSSLYAALFYLIMTHLGAGALIAGFFLSSGGELLMPFEAMRQSLEIAIPAGLVGVPTLLIFVLFFFGFGSKAGLVPFHAWLPEAHPEAPSPISALMSGAMLKVAIYGLLRILITVLPAPTLSWALILIVFGLLSALYGVLYAIIHRDLKRILAFSSIENIGLITLMIGAMVFSNTMGWEELGALFLGLALFHCLAHAVFKAGLFMGAGAILHEVHTGNIEKMGGLAQRMPKLALAMLLLGLGAAGLPPLGAFTSEWLFIHQLMNGIGTGVPLAQGIFVIMLAAVALVAGLAIFAMTRLFGIVFLAAPRSEESGDAKEPSVGLHLPVLLMALLTIGIGFLAPLLFKQTLPLVPMMVLMLIVGLVVFAARRLTSVVAFERKYNTWDCGQPITADMEYTGTAFAAPIRFFFRSLLGVRKKVKFSPVTSSNPWIKKYSLAMDMRSIFWDFLYVPVKTTVLFVSFQVRKIQNGSLRFYIGLILAALMVTFILAS